MPVSLDFALDDYTPVTYRKAAVEISYDPAKNARNIRERGIPLAYGAVVIVNAVGIVEDDRIDYSEIRLKAYAEIDGSWMVCTYTMRGDVFHIVSVHRVREKEARKWLGR